MTTYQLLPPLTADELARLEADIAEHGVLKPIHIDEQGTVIDGHHRKAIAERHGFEVPHVVLHGLSEAEKVDRSLSLNLTGRNLSNAAKREVTAAYLVRRPDVSDREAAALIGVSHPTVASVRADLKANGKVFHKDDRRESSGRAARGRKPNELTPEQVAATAKVDAKRAAKRQKYDEKMATTRAKQEADEAAMRARHEAAGGAVAGSSRAPRRDIDLHERLVTVLSSAILGLTQAMNDPAFDAQFAKAERDLPVNGRVEASRVKLTRLISQLRAGLETSAIAADSPHGELIER